ncbi:MAG: SAM-dependent methyltransferase, partial [Proteobacteria bacterium]|nr:SAM-dependent methyltransferase [Pseudomonadota bacterium]
DAIPDHFVGVILANEVCDAMPVHCLQFDNGIAQERYIECINGELQWIIDELSQTELTAHTETIISLIGDASYRTEVNLAAESWLASIAENIQQGAVFIIDYGYTKTDYYHPQRSDGTLMCYYQHQGHDNPLILQGLQDITAHVDFTALAQVAFDSGLQVAGFQSQADFLLAGGITEFSDPNADALTQLQQATEIKQLTLPSEMGENFKVLSLTKGLDQLLNKAQLGDRRHSL